MAQLDKDCPTRQLMEFMADKWVPGMIYALSHGTQRPSELSRRLDGISRKMLTQTLRNLEHWGLVKRKVYQVVPPKVEYSLTATGRKFTEPLALMCDWAEANAATVHKINRRRQSAG